MAKKNWWQEHGQQGAQAGPQPAAATDQTQPAPGAPPTPAEMVDRAIASDFAAINTACEVLANPHSNPEELKGARTSINNAIANLRGHSRGQAGPAPMVAALSPAVEQALINALTQILPSVLSPALVAAIERAIAMGAFNEPVPKAA